MFDLGDAAGEMTRLVTGVRDDQLPGPTPCSDWTVTDLLAHIHVFAYVFTRNARKDPLDQLPDGLADDWREAVPAQLDELARAWREDSAWQGRVSAGGVEMDAADNAIVAVEELTVHGWDLARASGQSFTVPDDRLDRVDRFFEVFAEPIAAGKGPYGPQSATPDEQATRLDKTIARTGRDPSWAA